jgi:hypothetical protein
MKCPKCGYTSFESYDSCRKCSADLVAFKQTHGLSALVLPPSLRANMVAGPGGENTAANAPSDSNEGDMFAFDLPTDQQTTAAASSTATPPFSFDDAPTAAPTFSFDTPPPVQQDPFASLLETTSQDQKPTPPPLSQQGFETTSFSWDDTPASVPPDGSKPAGGTKSDDDDFNSLFGDLDGSVKK